MDTYPKELRKKVTLIKHFRGYMQDNLDRVTGHEELQERGESFDYLSKYLRTKEGVIFRISNNVFQVCLLTLCLY